MEISLMGIEHWHDLASAVLQALRKCADAEPGAGGWMVSTGNDVVPQSAVDALVYMLGTHGFECRIGRCRAHPDEEHRFNYVDISYAPDGDRCPPTRTARQALESAIKAHYD
jgi:hypothetical protein